MSPGLKHHAHTVTVWGGVPLSSWVRQPNVPSVTRVCADKPIYSNLPVVWNNGGTESMGHTTHIKLVLWKLTAIRLLGYMCVGLCERGCVYMYIHFLASHTLSVCVFVCVREVKWCHYDFPGRQLFSVCQPVTRPLVHTLHVHLSVTHTLPSIRVCVCVPYICNCMCQGDYIYLS